MRGVKRFVVGVGVVFGPIVGFLMYATENKPDDAASAFGDWLALTPQFMQDRPVFVALGIILVLLLFIVLWAVQPEAPPKAPRTKAARPFLHDDLAVKKLRGRLQRVKDRHKLANVHIQHFSSERAVWWAHRIAEIFRAAGWIVLDGGGSTKLPFHGADFHGYKPELVADTVQAFKDTGLSQATQQCDAVQVPADNPKHDDSLHRINLTLGLLDP